MPKLDARGAVLSADKIPSEDHEQMHLVQWFRRTYPLVRIFAIPNGGHRHPAVAAKMKATGVSSGVPDLFIPEWQLWIEMKRTKGGSLSMEQKDWIKYLEDVGYCVKVCKGAEAAKKQIQAFVTIENLTE